MYSGVLLCYFLPKFPIYNHAKIQNRKPYLKLFIQIQKGLQTTGAICETNQTCLTYQFTKALYFQPIYLMKKFRSTTNIFYLPLSKRKKQKYYIKLILEPATPKLRLQQECISFALYITRQNNPIIKFLMFQMQSSCPTIRVSNLQRHLMA